ncbi:GNAT family N-acetyltransferase [Streptococcus cameli]
MKEIGIQTLEADRILLRPFRIEDAAAMYRNWASRTDNIQYVPWSAHTSPDFTEELIQEWIDSYTDPNSYRWGIAFKEKPDELIGDLSVVSLNPKTEAVEIGYILSKDYWGQGLMTEALKRALAFLFDEVEVNRVVIGHAKENAASGRVIQKAGLHYEGTFRQAVLLKGTLVDLVSYAILKEDYDNQKPA